MKLKPAKNIFRRERLARRARVRSMRINSEQHAGRQEQREQTP